MPQASEYFVKECKTFIDHGYLDSLEAFINDHSQVNNLAWEYIIQKLYLHACLKKMPELADRILAYLPSLDPIQQIAIRQTLPYGKWLLSR